MKEIYAALGQATATASAVGKRSKNEHHRYQYASSEHVIEEARDALHTNGLAFYCWEATVTALCEIETESVDPDGVLRKQRTTQWQVRCVYRLTHSSGEHLDIESSTPIMPEKGRPLDKALATAKTYDLAYTLRSLLLLPRLDPREIAEEPVDQRREGPAPIVATQNAGEGAEIIAALKTCDASQLVDLTRRAMKYFGSLPQDSAERSAGRAALTAAQARLA